MTTKICKVVMPAICKAWSRNGNEINAKGFCKIVYENGKLSITGVIGPHSGGNCLGSAGQCTDSIRNGTPAKGWTREMLDRFCNIWDEWHLNDMRPYCRHQKELGWNEEAGQEITLYHYKLTDQAAKLQKQAKEAAMNALKSGETFTTTPDQVFYANLEYFLDTYADLDETRKELYVPYKSSLGKPPQEKEKRGWVRFEKDPRGILCKPCPVCGYKYGTAWIKEDVPQDVIDWLLALPDTPVQPAWC